MGRALRVVLGSMAGAILGFAMGGVVAIGKATPMITSPVTLFTIVGGIFGAFVGLRARKGIGVGRVSLLVVLLAVTACAIIAFVIAKLMWHEFERGMFHF